ncbi:hypothetical protein LX64_01953 [Chitinophaga skermanii]|uniref:Uncharacterized protein n=1 Tax=Chitinophaga skermanii TaxID=331697 RepID=A0A327QQF9_9BACT|nr:hypothetical protein [Chitinophaga skermanii]RAJ06826.1 hypothetical protein LX64_01953 [Chitinophaga skermanii]
MKQVVTPTVIDNLPAYHRFFDQYNQQEREALFEQCLLALLGNDDFCGWTAIERSDACFHLEQVKEFIEKLANLPFVEEKHGER